MHKQYIKKTKDPHSKNPYSAYQETVNHFKDGQVKTVKLTPEQMAKLFK